MNPGESKTYTDYTFSLGLSEVKPEFIARLADNDTAERAWAASRLFTAGMTRAISSLRDWVRDFELQKLMDLEQVASGRSAVPYGARLTVGIAVQPPTFERIRAANGSPALAHAPADQDVLEFELDFAESGMPHIRLDILTTKAPGGNGAIARFLEKFGEGIQQVEIDVADVDRVTEILRTRFKVDPIYPATRGGANGTRVNFFLVTWHDDKKALIELVELPKGSHQSPVTGY